MAHHAIHPQVVVTVLAISSKVLSLPFVVTYFVVAQCRHGSGDIMAAFFPVQHWACVGFGGTNPTFGSLIQPVFFPKLTAS